MRYGQHDIAARTAGPLTERTSPSDNPWARGIEARFRAFITHGEDAQRPYEDAIRHLARSRTTVHLAWVCIPVTCSHGSETAGLIATAPVNGGPGIGVDRDGHARQARTGPTTPLPPPSARTRGRAGFPPTHRAIYQVDVPLRGLSAAQDLAAASATSRRRLSSW